MSFISNLASLASNTPLQRLVPNGNGMSKHFNNYRNAISDGAYQRDLNRDFHKESVESLKGRMAGQLNEASAHATNNRVSKSARAERRADMAGTEAHRMKEIQGTAKYVDSQGKINADGLRAARSGQQDVLNALTKQRQEAGRGMRQEAKDYFMSGDLGTNAMRWGAVAGAYGGLAVGTRALTGGSATTNNQGQRDIAGIPFI